MTLKDATLQQLPEVTGEPIPERPPGFQLQPLGDLLNNVTGANYLIKPYLERGTMGVLSGDSDSLKTFISIDMLCRIAYGLDYHGKSQCKPEPVVMLNGEGKQHIAKRILAFKVSQGLTEDAPIYISTIPAQLISQVDTFEISKIIEDTCNPSLVVIDTLSTNFGDGDENSNSDISTLLNNVAVHLRDKFNACVLIVHHVGHGDKARERGAYAIRGNVDFRIFVERQNGPGSPVNMVCKKVKDGEPWAPISFNHQVVPLPGVYDSEGEQATSLVLTSTEYEAPQKPKSVRLGKTQKEALSVLDSMYQEHRKTLSDNDYSENSARVLVDDWQTELTSKGIINNRQHFYQIKTKLQDKGLINVSAGYVEKT